MEAEHPDTHCRHAGTADRQICCAMPAAAQAMQKGTSQQPQQPGRQVITTDADVHTCQHSALPACMHCWLVGHGAGAIKLHTHMQMRISLPQNSPLTTRRVWWG